MVKVVLVFVRLVPRDVAFLFRQFFLTRFSFSLGLGAIKFCVRQINSVCFVVRPRILSRASTRSLQLSIAHPHSFFITTRNPKTTRQFRETMTLSKSKMRADALARARAGGRRSPNAPVSGVRTGAPASNTRAAANAQTTPLRRSNRGTASESTTSSAKKSTTPATPAAGRKWQRGSKPTRDQARKHARSTMTALDEDADSADDDSEYDDGKGDTDY